MTAAPIGLFPLGEYSRSVPLHAVRIHVGVEVLGLMYPRGAAPARGDERLVSRAAMAGPIDLPLHFERNAPSPVSRAALRDYVLVCRPQGDFLSTDQLSLASLRRQQDTWQVELTVVRREDRDGEPAPRDLYLVFGLEVDNPPIRRLELRFSARWLDFKGGEMASGGPIGAPMGIEITD